MSFLIIDEAFKACILKIATKCKGGSSFLRYKVLIAYDGTEFYGWQEQLNFPTIQSKIQESLEKISGERVGVTGAGRTDSGVHAFEQVAHFNWNHSLPAERLILAMNAILPKSIRILDISETADDFHARYDARSKLYLYRIDRNRVHNPFHYRYSLHFSRHLDLELLKESVCVLEGEHDFKAFQATGTELLTTVRTMFKVEAFSTSADNFTEWPFFCIRFQATGFLRKMARFMVGTLLEISSGKRNPEDLKNALTTGDRKFVGVPAPARGLFLEKVLY